MDSGGAWRNQELVNVTRFPEDERNNLKAEDLEKSGKKDIWSFSAHLEKHAVCKVYQAYGLESATGRSPGVAVEIAFTSLKSFSLFTK